MAKKLRLFFAAFFCTVSACLLCYGFFLVDENTRLTGLRDNEPFFTVVKAAPLSYNVQLFGETASLSLGWLNTAARYAQQGFCFLPPTLRLAMRLFSLS